MVLVGQATQKSMTLHAGAQKLTKHSMQVTCELLAALERLANHAGVTGVAT